MSGLWPSKFNGETEVSPKRFIEEQLNELETLTGGRVYGEVKEAKPINTQDILCAFCYKIVIRSKYLDNYTFNFLRISYNIPYYPMAMSIESQIYNEIEPDIRRELTSINNETEFSEILTKIFHSERLGRIIGTLMQISSDEDA